MVNYSNGKIYKIEALNAPIDEKVYVGSTTKQYLCQRMDTHRADYKRWIEGKFKGCVRSYELFDKYGVDNCVIVLIESVNANSKDELHAREKHYIQTLNSINKNIPLRTRKEYREDNNDKIKERMKVYREENKLIIHEKDKIYRENNKHRRGKYVEENKDAIKEYKKEHYLKHKVEILEKGKEIFKCECGSEFRISEKSRHYKSKKHTEFLEGPKENVIVDIKLKALEKKEKRKQLFLCECGTECRSCDKARHYKSLKHQAFIKIN
jgi:hypothetical protein